MGEEREQTEKMEETRKELRGREIKTKYNALHVTLKELISLYVTLKSNSRKY